jgi:hypothetical protein
MVDAMCEPFMKRISAENLLVTMFGVGKGSGAGMLIFFLGIEGMVICLIFGRILKKYKYHDPV